MIDHGSGIPVYRQLADYIRGQIESGDLAPGQRLPSEPTYMDEYGVGRSSVREAMAVLRKEGLIVTTRRGSRVRELPPLVEVVVTADTRVGTRLPTEPERRRMGIAEGVAVFVVCRPGVEPELLAGDQVTLVVK
jgi:DNA-binding GntR family transcriptional regulator